MFGPDLKERKSGILKVSFWLFVGGFFALPFLWLLNWIYLRPVLKHPNCPPQARKYVRWSMILFAVEVTAMVVYYVLFVSLHKYLGPDRLIDDLISLYVGPGM